jgi:hypothetical protein
MLFVYFIHSFIYLFIGYFFFSDFSSILDRYFLISFNWFSVVSEIQSNQSMSNPSSKKVIEFLFRLFFSFMCLYSRLEEKLIDSMIFSMLKVMISTKMKMPILISINSLPISIKMMKNTIRSIFHGYIQLSKKRPKQKKKNNNNNNPNIYHKN